MQNHDPFFDCRFATWLIRHCRAVGESLVKLSNPDFDNLQIRLLKVALKSPSAVVILE